jgi:hypothetical protein
MGKAEEILQSMENPTNKPYGEARVWFDYHQELSHEKSAEEGRAQYNNILVIKIQHVGDSVPTTKRAKKRDIAAYQEEYNYFMNGNTEEPPHQGLPLREWGMMPGSLARELELKGVYTVEQLADLQEKHGHVYAKLGPAQEWCEKAKDFVAATTKKASMTSLKAENKKLAAHVEALEQQVRRLSQQVEAEQGPIEGVTNAK